MKKLLVTIALAYAIATPLTAHRTAPSGTTCSSLAGLYHRASGTQWRYPYPDLGKLTATYHFKNGILQDDQQQGSSGLVGDM
ncbi:MAG: hypothetical protein IJJ62_05210 [Prevotella sp.]|nr:hypothetical protein [Prevotella sp.]MBQ6406232.1 hypothetical protein [Prevotella sp.]